MPTQAATLTGQGVIVGTLQYMAPEQLEGKPADARTDLWALGAILYEMVTGKRAFEGTSAASLIARHHEREPPPLATLQPLTPPALDRLVRQCLAKAPDDRPDTAHDVANDLRWMRETSGVGALAGVQPKRRRALRAHLVVGGLAMAAAAGAAVAGIIAWRLMAPLRAPAHFQFDVRPAETLPVTEPLDRSAFTEVALSPDERSLIFAGMKDGTVQLDVCLLDRVGLSRGHGNRWYCGRPRSLRVAGWALDWFLGGSLSEEGPIRWRSAG